MDGFGDWKAVLANADVDTVELIAQLQVEDVLALSSARRSQNGIANDEDSAIQVLQHELQTLQVDLPNRKLGEDLEELDNDQQETFEAAAFGWKLKQWEGHVEHVPDPTPAPKPIECTSCAEDFAPWNIMEAPCGDEYCRGCLEYLFKQCITDETLFPPRCCRLEIPFELAKPYLGQRCKSKFGGKRVELQTKDRTYCHVPTCSAFIKPDYISADAKACCPKCKEMTCSLCKNAWHIGDCPRDTTMDMIESLAANNSWQRCSDCHRILELKYGCNHMTCLCKHEFCYVCGVTWKNCECPQWDEERLIERAEQVVVENRFGHDWGVEEAAEFLRENHECTHERFKGIGGENRTFNCEICGNTYETWIQKCVNCGTLICNRCKKHRL